LTKKRKRNTSLGGGKKKENEIFLTRPFLERREENGPPNETNQFLVFSPLKKQGKGVPQTRRGYFLLAGERKIPRRVPLEWKRNSPSCPPHTGEKRKDKKKILTNHRSVKKILEKSPELKRS